MTIIHHLTDVQTINIGKNTRIWQYCVILQGAKIGADCNISSHCFVENDVLIGDRVTLKSGVYLWDGISIEDEVFIGPNATFTNDRYPKSKNHLGSYPKFLIKKGASIGAGSVFTPGLTIGQYAMIGAGSVVTKNVPDFTIWYGNPAKRRGYICACGIKITDKKGSLSLICTGCNAKYVKKNRGLQAT